MFSRQLLKFYEVLILSFCFLTLSDLFLPPFLVKPLLCQNISVDIFKPALGHISIACND